MPLKCLKDTEELYAFDFRNNDAWAALRDENKRTRCLSMPCCSAAVVLKTSKLGTRYFAHSRRGRCTSAPESAEHLLAKAAIAEGVRRAGWNVKVEQRGGTPSGEPWIADVLATKHAHSVAFEVQWSRQSWADTRSRQARYEAAGIRAMWLFRQYDFISTKDLPAFRLKFVEALNTFYVLIPSPLHAPTVPTDECDAAQYWHQEIELSTFIEGALTGRLHYAPALNRILPLDVMGAPTRCWRCGEEINVVLELVFAAGEVMPACPNIHALIYDFDALPQGDKLIRLILSRHLLAKNGIGEIRPRFSKSQSTTYISNGCVYCDALQGQFFDRHLIHLERKLLRIDLYFDEMWAGKLTHASPWIYVWWFDTSPQN